MLAWQAWVENTEESCKLSDPPAIESSIAIEDPVENCGLYRRFVSRLFYKALDTIAV